MLYFTNKEPGTSKHEPLFTMYMMFFKGVMYLIRPEQQAHIFWEAEYMYMPCGSIGVVVITYS
jgi:hypothetical protein